MLETILDAFVWLCAIGVVAAVIYYVLLVACGRK